MGKVITPNPDPQSADLGDWRLGFTGWAIGADGETWLEPKPVSRMTVYRDGIKQFTFQSPSAAAMQLDIAWSSAERAEAIRSRIHLVNADPLPGYPRISVQVPAAYSSELFDCLQEMMVSAFFSCAAIESYCNQMIADRAKGPIEVRGKKGPEQLPPEVAVERLSTDEKLGRVVPRLLGTPSISGRKEWQHFLKLRGIRDSITHFKRHDAGRQFPDLHQPTALFSLYQADSFEYFDAAHAVLAAVMPKDKERWMHNPKWQRRK